MSAEGLDGELRELAPVDAEEASGAGPQGLAPLLEPIAYPSNYLGGFLRPYYVAEAIASRVLHTQAQLSAMGAFAGGEEGLLCGAVMAARGLESLGLPAGLPSTARLTVRVCLVHPPAPLPTLPPVSHPGSHPVLNSGG
jgi:hypothetical protein